MTTDKQIEANRRNAEKSTGPRSEEGKARSSMNAIKHGLRAEQPVILGENPADYQRVSSPSSAPRQCRFSGGVCNGLRRSVPHFF